MSSYTLRLKRPEDIAAAEPDVVARSIRLLGPFSIAWNTPDITTIPSPVKAFDLEEGQTVVRVWCVNTAFWDGEDVGLAISVGRASALASAIPLHDPYYLPLGGPYASAGADIEDLMGTAGDVSPFTRAATATDSDVGIYVGLIGLDTPTQGTADIYALIAGDF